MTNLIKNRMALLCLVDEQVIADLFNGKTSGNLNQWAEWTHPFGSDAVEDIRIMLGEYGQLNLYLYVWTAPNEGSVSFRIIFDDFERLDGSTLFRGKPCLSNFRFGSYEALSPPLQLSDLRNTRTGEPVDSPSKLRGHFTYIVDPAYDGPGMSKRWTGRHRRAPKSTLSVESAYTRISPRRVSEIYKKHEKLESEFAAWLQANGVNEPEMERNFIDISFEYEKKSYMVEIKTTHGVSTCSAIREALGQVLEYNYYYEGSPADRWIVLLDSQPSEDDLNYVRRIRDVHSLPLTIGWTHESGFRFAAGPSTETSCIPQF